MAIYPKMIMEALATVTYAGTKKNLVESGMVADQPAVAQREDGSWKVTVVLEFPRDTDPFLKSTVKAAEAAIKYHCAKALDGMAVEAEGSGTHTVVLTADGRVFAFGLNDAGQCDVSGWRL